MSRARDLADAGSKANYLDNVTSDINTSISAVASVPVGSIFQMAFEPDATWLSTNEYLICNGAEYAIATYGDLYTAIGTTWGSLTNGSGSAGSTHFVVPDLRGEFLRGWANGSTNDPDRNSRTGGDNVGSSQASANKQHEHLTVYDDISGYQRYSTPTGIFGGSGACVPLTHWAWSGTYTTNTYGSTDSGSPSVYESRPRNKYVQYCIKY